MSQRFVLDNMNSQSFRSSSHHILDNKWPEGPGSPNFKTLTVNLLSSVETNKNVVFPYTRSFELSTNVPLLTKAVGCDFQLRSMGGASY